MKILWDGGECAEVAFWVEGMLEEEFRGVEHGASDGLEEGIVDGLGAILAISEDGVPCHGEVSADLVGASGFDAYEEVASALVGADACDVCEGAFFLDGKREGRGGGIPALLDDGAIGFAEVVFAEDMDGGLEGIVVLGKEEAARGIAVEAMDGAEGGVGGLDAQDGLDAGVAALGEEACGFIGDEEVGIVDEDADGFGSGGECGGGSDARGESYDIALMEGMVGHPDAAVIDPYGAGINLLFGGAFGDAECFGEVILEGDGCVFRWDDPLILFWCGHGRNPRASASGARMGGC